jgi:hypothetical protein
VQAMVFIDQSQPDVYVGKISVHEAVGTWQSPGFREWR